LPPVKLFFSLVASVNQYGAVRGSVCIVRRFDRPFGLKQLC